MFYLPGNFSVYSCRPTLYHPMRIVLFPVLFVLAMALFCTSCLNNQSRLPEKGVSQELARQRYNQISRPAYELSFHIPATKAEPVAGTATITFTHEDPPNDVILDFDGGSDHIHQVKINGEAADYDMVNGHLLLPRSFIRQGHNRVYVEFTSGEQAMNRSEEFLYTLVVPDRASTVFPCFDQPDLKAVFSLNLELPETWTAIANGELTLEQQQNGRRTMFFSPDQPIPTYLFAFAAGVFQTESMTRGNRTITLFHREDRDDRLQTNLDDIFELHFSALDWLETYTGIPYPFLKFEMALLPGFQYSGMEHPGAIWYRDNRLILDEEPARTEALSRAALIAHETAHMWFGNLVTMEWFDDVWLKEVFAGFMADKITHPQYPEINHELEFFLTHYPRALAVDRSQGTHPIKQELENLKLAGTLYGAIIYNKAPIVFRNLEEIMGQESFRLAVQEYLRTYAMDNADWDDLAEIFDRHSKQDLEQWSERWIYGTGMPEISTEGMDEETARAARYLKMHERFLDGEGDVYTYFRELKAQIRREESHRIATYLLHNLDEVFWRFFDQDARMRHAAALESLLWDRVQQSPASEKNSYLGYYASVVLTDSGTNRLVALLEGSPEIPGHSLPEERRFNLIAALKLRDHPEAPRLLQELKEHTASADRQRRIAFVQPALSSDPSVREAFFHGLADPDNRRPEPWAIEGLGYFHHPLRHSHSVQFITPGLELLEEVQETGDIFFPLRWLEATFRGYGCRESVTATREFLEQDTDLHPNLRLKTLQAADLMFRAASRSPEPG